VGFSIGGFTGEILCGFADKLNGHQHHRGEEKLREQYRSEKSVDYNNINTFVDYFMKKCKKLVLLTIRLLRTS
jgi:hypothetical protein